MENEVFERDYTQVIHGESEENAISDAIFERAIYGRFFEEFEATMKALPKSINPKSKADYEYVLALCDSMAQGHRGKLVGEVRYDKWDAVIYLTLPFFEFCDAQKLAELREIAERANSLTFSPTEDGNIQLYIFFYYFDDVTGEESAEEIKERLIRNDPELVALLEQRAEMRDATVTNTLEKIHQLAELLAQETGQEVEEVLEAFSKMTFNKPEVFKQELLELFGLTEWPDDI